MSGHTPGPWTAKDELGKYDNSMNSWTVEDEDATSSSCAPITLADGTVVAFAVESDDVYTFVSSDQLDANASLIASAPDLFEVADTAPVISKYHGTHGFEADRFIDDYAVWSAKKRQALGKARGVNA